MKAYPPPLRFVNTGGPPHLLGRYAAMTAVPVRLCLAACKDYDDTDLWNTMNDLEERVAALEEWQDRVNGNIAAIQELLNTPDLITSVTEITSDGNPIRANGEDGQDGETGATGAFAPTPQIKLGGTITSGTLHGLDGDVFINGNRNRG